LHGRILAAVLDEYFSDITVERVEPGQGWRRIEALPPLPFART
jgi:hypothetical protein